MQNLIMGVGCALVVSARTVKDTTQSKGDRAVCARGLKRGDSSEGQETSSILMV